MVGSWDRERPTKIFKNGQNNLTFKYKSLNLKVTVGKSGELWSEILLNFNG